MIIDAHVHLLTLQGSPADRVAGLLSYADRLGIGVLCVSMGLTLERDPSPEQVREANDAVLAAMAAFPTRVRGWCYVNPKDVKGAQAEIRRCVADGPMFGVKLLIAERCSAPCVAEVAACCAELGAPILQHAWLKTQGNEPGESTPEDVVALANQCPNALIIMAHSGGKWERGIRAVADCPNVWVDVCGTYQETGFVELAVRLLGPNRVVWGSDAGSGRGFASQLGKVLGADISAEAKERVLRLNMEGLISRC